MRRPAESSWEKFHTGPRTKAGPLETQMAKLLEDIKGESVFVDKDLPIEGQLKEHKEYMIEAARHYDSTRKELRATMETDSPFDENSLRILEEAKGLIGKEEWEKTTAFLNEVRASIMEILEGMDQQGLDYLARGKFYKNMAAEVLARVFAKAEKAKDYKYPVEDAQGKDYPRESDYYALELQRINEILDTLEAKYPATIVKDLIVEHVNGMMHHLQKELGEEYLTHFKRTDSPEFPRGIDVMQADPLRQIELMIDVVRVLVRELGNIQWTIELHKAKEQVKIAGKEGAVSA